MTNATADFSTGGPFQYIRKITVLQWGQCLHFRLNGGIGIRFFCLEPTILDVIISGSLRHPAFLYPIREIIFMGLHVSKNPIHPIIHFILDGLGKSPALVSRRKMPLTIRGSKLCRKPINGMAAFMEGGCVRGAPRTAFRIGINIHINIFALAICAALMVSLCNLDLVFILIPSGLKVRTLASVHTITNLIIMVFAELLSKLGVVVTKRFGNTGPGCNGQASLGTAVHEDFHHHSSSEPEWCSVRPLAYCFQSRKSWC